MQVHHEVASFHRAFPRTALAIGNFDGVHRGHRRLLEALRSGARSAGLPACVLTFYPHPVEVLRPGTTLQRLSTTEEKLALLESLGLDGVLVEKFRPELARLDPDVFYREYLRRGLGVERLYVGFNFRFGRQRLGSTDELAAWTRRDGVGLHVEPAYLENGVKIDSTGIRAAIGRGDVGQAAAWLGRRYTMTGQVAHGDHRGRELGFPTANVRIPWGKCLPATGVYVTRTEWQRQWFPSVTNLGIRPTVMRENPDSPPEVRLETHLLDWQGPPLYDETLTIEFVEHLRPERKFESLDALKAQIALDAAAARARLASVDGPRGTNA